MQLGLYITHFLLFPFLLLRYLVFLFVLCKAHFKDSTSFFMLQNARVVDASVLSFQLSSHFTGTLYTVAERASDLIKKGYIFFR